MFKLKKKILLVEKDERYAERLKQMIVQQGYTVTHLTSPIKAVAEFTKKNYDLVISDFSMKEMDGIKLLAILKEIKPNVRSIVLTAYTRDEVEIEAIDREIDYCLCKDKKLDVLSKYIQSLLMKDIQAEALTNDTLTSSSERITVDMKQRIVLKDNIPVPLTTKEYELLVLFLKNKGIALSREEISEELWSKDIEPIDLRVIDGHIKRLRSKLSLFSISSIRGYGYKWSEK